MVANGPDERSEQGRRVEVNEPASEDVASAAMRPTYLREGSPSARDCAVLKTNQDANSPQLAMLSWMGAGGPCSGVAGSR